MRVGVNGIHVSYNLALTRPSPASQSGAREYLVALLVGVLAFYGNTHRTVRACRHLHSSAEQNFPRRYERRSARRDGRAVQGIPTGPIGRR